MNNPLPRGTLMLHTVVALLAKVPGTVEESWLPQGIYFL
jgi:hypothetical protein